MIVIWSPVKNEARHIEEMLRSVLGQTYQDWRLVVSDNYSDDGTGEIVRRYCEADGRITLVQPPEKMAGQPHANWLWRHLADTMTAKAAMFIGGHDAIDRDYLLRLYSALASNKSLACVYPKNALMIDDENRPVSRWGSCPQTINVPQPIRFLSMLLQMGQNIPFFGLMCWPAFCAVTPTRACTAHDHFICSELTFYGDFYEVEGATLSLRRSPGFGDYGVYRAKHMAGDTSIVDDVRVQLEWLDDLATRAGEGGSPGYGMTIKSLCRLAYLTHRLNLSDAGTQQLLQAEFPKLWSLVAAAVEVA